MFNKDLNRNIVLALSIVLAITLLYYFREIVTYVLIAWVISMLGQPLMKVLRRVRIGKHHFLPPSVSAGLVLLFFLLLVTGLVSIFVPLVVEQGNNLSSLDVNAFVKGLQQPLSELTNLGHRFGLIAPKEDIVQAAQHTFTKWISPMQISNLLSTILLTASDTLVGAISVLFISFFFLRERNVMLTDFIASVVSASQEHGVREAVRDTTTMLSRYFSGLLMQMLFVAVCLTLALWLLGIQNALLIGIFAALINIVPYLGPMMACAFAIFITISSNLGLDFYDQVVPMIVKVVVTFSFMQLVNDWIVQPIIFSNRVAAHPLEIFLVTLVGAKLGGIGGMILAIPTYTVARIVAREFFNQYRIVQKITSSLEDSELFDNQ
jgi:predicted PurR-regulated permease PerM